MQRRGLTNEERNERAEARIQDYINDRLSEQVTRASLLALGFSFDEIEEKINNAAAEWARSRINKDNPHMQASAAWLDGYLKR